MMAEIEGNDIQLSKSRKMPNLPLNTTVFVIEWRTFITFENGRV